MAAKQGYGLDIKKYLKMNGNRHICGVLKGSDVFMNLMLENAAEFLTAGKRDLGTVFIRGNTVVTWECLDKVTN